MACRIFGAPPQYASLRASTTFTPGSHISSLNGPVPTGCLTTSLPHFFSDSGLNMKSDWCARYWRNGVSGALSLICTALASSTSTPATLPRKPFT